MLGASGHIPKQMNIAGLTRILSDYLLSAQLQEAKRYVKSMIEKKR